MKLLHVTDLHFRARWFEWVSGQAPHYDAVCIAGDLLDMLGTAKTSLRAQAEWTQAWLREFPGRLFVCSGNHDWWDRGGSEDTGTHGGWLDQVARPEVTVDGQGAPCGDLFISCHAFRAPPVWPLDSAAPCSAGPGGNGHRWDREQRPGLPAVGRSTDHGGPAAVDRPVGPSPQTKILARALRPVLVAQSDLRRTSFFSEPHRDRHRGRIGNVGDRTRRNMAASGAVIHGPQETGVARGQPGRTRKRTPPRPGVRCPDCISPVE